MLHEQSSFSDLFIAHLLGRNSRSRVNFCMNRFRKLGFIEYGGKLPINSSVLSVVLHDEPSRLRSHGRWGLAMREPGGSRSELPGESNGAPRWT